MLTRPEDPTLRRRKERVAMAAHIANALVIAGGSNTNKLTLADKAVQIADALLDRLEKA